MCPCTLVDRKQKRQHNVVDVVIRLHDLTDQAPKARHLRVLAHVQLDDVPRTPIPRGDDDDVLPTQGFT